MTDIAELGIKIEAKDIKEAVRELDRLENQSRKTEKATDGLVGQTTKLVASLGAVALVASTIRNALQVTAEFEKLKSSLEVVTGSSENAAEALSLIRKMASGTPYSVRQLTEAFIKLKALGLDPSKDALTSYGNTASAMGKDLNQMIEAVADAATGEFERLKEFGIKASSQGDQVSFTFQGVTKTVGKNAKEIEKYLRDIGKVQFAGAMEKQMDTLNGALSNLGDNFDNFMLTIGESGLSGAAKASLGDLSRILQDPGILKAASGITSALVESFSFAGKVFATFALRFQDLADTLGAYGAAIKEVFSLNFESAKTIIALRKEQLKVTDANVKAIWDEKKATEELDKTKENATKKAVGGGSGGGGDGGGLTKEQMKAIKAAKKEREKRKEELSTQLKDLQDHYASEQELALNAFYERTALIDELEKERIGTEDERMQLRLDANSEYQDKLTEIEQAAALKRKELSDKEYKERVDAANDALTNLSSLMISKNKQMFEVGKAAAIAQTIISTYSSAQKSYDALASIPYVGPALGAAAAAAAIAAGLARVNAIKSQSMTGGGGVSAAGSSGGVTVGGGMPTIAEPPPDRSKDKTSKELRVTVEGDGPHSEGMRKFAENLAETLRDMGSDTQLVLS